VWRLSLINLAIFFLFTAFQLVRARMEEMKLELNFPEYGEYVSKTWWFWN
jgi:protein-S-isoprenylcysteine O-methyltransferase Ste14